MYSASYSDDSSGQPEIITAPNQKAFKQKERSDRHINTFETDPVFLAFTAKLALPVDKLPSAEVQLDQKKDTLVQSREELIRNNPLLKYMREKAEKKLMERKLLRKGSSAKSLLVTGVLSKSSRGSKGGGASASTSTGALKGEKSGRNGSSRKEGRPPREARESAEITGVEGSAKVHTYSCSYWKFIFFKMQASDVV